MPFNLKRALWLWAGTLAMALLVIVPMTGLVRASLMLAVLGGVGLARMRIGKRARRQRQALLIADQQSLPPPSWRYPVVLVCGDGLRGLFGAIPADQVALRVTAHGCYVRVTCLESLPQLIGTLISLRPDWGRQLSVMFVVNAQQQVDGERLAGRVRVLRHQLMRARKGGIALPLMLTSYLHAGPGVGPWFSWQAGQALPDVHDGAACVGVQQWQAQAADTATRATRLQASVQLNSAAAWLAQTVLPELAGPVALSAVTFVSVMPQVMAGNLWQRWLHDRVAVADQRSPAACASATLPFPDPLLAQLPSDNRASPKRRAGLIALWLLMAAAGLALLSSAWQNTLLARQVSDDMRRYFSIQATDHDHRQQALDVLRGDASRLDSYYRHGAPLSLGFGLYRGESLRAPLWAAIAGHRQPQQPGSTVRLDSLSLFASGSAQLKPESAKVLINALVGIKAQPGWLIVIAGHTDGTGSAEHNLQLSRARAAAVRHWMGQMGDIPDSCFAVQGFGASRPVANNDSESGRQANRRVEIRLVPDVGACLLPTAGAGRQPSPHNAAIKH
ncbi:OmpA family protein [Pseudomonas sp. S2_C03]